MMYALLFVVVLALAYANGANDNMKPFATVYGSGVLPYRRALAFATGSQVAVAEVVTEWERENPKPTD